MCKMSIRPGKTRQMTISASKPSPTSQNACKSKAEEGPSAMPLDFEGFKCELHEDLVDAIKNEVALVCP